MTTNGASGFFFQVLLWITLVTLFVAAPVMAGTRYLSGSPDLQALVNGTGEYLPGSELTLEVLIQNSGLDEIKVIQPGLATREDTPSSAKMVTATLRSGTAPVIVKSEPQMVGDISGGTAKLVPFVLKVRADAESGTYLLPLEVNYTYLLDAEQAGADSMIFHYRTGNVTLPVPFTIKPEVLPEVTCSTAWDLNSGGEGYLTLVLKNSGSLAGKEAVARIYRNDLSPVIPVDSSVYIGNFSPGAVVECRFKIRIAEDAQAETYPLDIGVEYLDDQNAAAASDRVTIGIPVAGKTRFQIVSPPVEIFQGSSRTIELQYENAGPVTIYQAQARLSAGDPFTAIDDIAFLGDLEPGQRAAARFEISVDKSATIKEYGLDTEIRYRDAVDENRISDPMKVRVMVLKRSGIEQVIFNPVLMSVIIGIVIGIGYYVGVHRRNKAR